jgi:hypothetical protein
MSIAELIYQQAKRLPEFQAREVLDFIDFLAHKKLAAQVQPAADWQERLPAIAGIQWNGRKPIGGAACPCLDNHAKTVAERVLEDRV